MERMLINEGTSIDDVKTDKKIGVEIEGDYKLIPDTDIRDRLNLLDEYNLERDNCTQYRMMVNIFPYCTNVLYNRISEIVKDEGSDSPINLIEESQDSDETNISDSEITHEQAIRDTEYSHPELGNYTYHCGMDIFNNHMLRTNKFISVRGYNEDYSGGKEDFNSIGDNSRNQNGDIIQEKIWKFDENEKNDDNDVFDTHLYTVDDIDDFDLALRERVSEQNGWLGFYNSTMVKIPTEKDKILNKIINNREACSFIDFYPERELFSFSGIKNNFKKRVEYNWNLDLMYPYKSDYDKFNEIIGDQENNINAIRVISYELIDTGNSISYIQFKTIINHNLKEGDRVNVFYRPHSAENTAIFNEGTITAIVRNVGKMNDYNRDKKHFFAVKIEDVPFMMHNEETLEEGYDVYIGKVDKGTPCRYYFRKFKKLKKGMKMDIGRIAFSKSIYGDDNAQILFPETIDIYGIKDNRGRELPEVYLEIVKNHAGNKEWYSGTTGADNIEYSHCFGKVTSGLDLPNDVTEYNIHKLHNIDMQEFEKNQEYRQYKTLTKKYLVDFLTPKPSAENGIPKAIDDDITKDTEEIYGDIVEYSPETDTETILEDVYHRFNTEQRECYYNKKYFDIKIEDIVSDDYDIPEKNESGELNISGNSFKTRRYNYGEEISTNDNGSMIHYVAYNLAPEGYYYKPLYKIDLKRITELPTEKEGMFLNCNFNNEDAQERGLYYKSSRDGKFKKYSEGTIYKDMLGDPLFMVTIISPVKYGFAKGDRFMFYDRTPNKKCYWGKLESVENNVKLWINVDVPKDEDDTERENFIAGLMENNYNVIMAGLDVPEYAAFVNGYEKKFVWREEEKYSELDSTDELYGTPFSNGNLYIEKNVMFFLHRQDPFGEYGLSMPKEKTVINMMNSNVPVGEKYVEKETEYIPIQKNIVCS